ncbi:MAG: UMP kinase, partial [Pseudomonadales bacterium]
MPQNKAKPRYKRILLKLSGEALGVDGVGIDPKVLD